MVHRGTSLFVSVLLASAAATTVEHNAVTPIRDYITPGSFRYNQLVNMPGTDFRYTPYTEADSCTWGINDGVSHRMSLRLSQGMASLARNVFQQLGGTAFNIRVIEGYQNATEAQRSAGDTSLYFEGRALLLQLWEGTSPVSDEQPLNVFYAQARLSGFDHVQQREEPSNGVLYVATLPDYCYNDRPIDLAFLIDGSSSIRDTDWVEARDFVEAVVANYFIGLNQTRVALSVFSSDRSQPVGSNLVDFPDAPNCPSTAWFSRRGGEAICVCVEENATCVGRDGAYCNDVEGAAHGMLGPIVVGLLNSTATYQLSWYVNNGSVQENGSEGSCTGGTPYFVNGQVLGTLPGNVEDILLFSDSSSSAVVQTTAASLILPGGATRTSLGLENIRESVMTLAAGARGASVPKVLVVMTDGQASPGYEPEEQARLLKDEGVTILAIGIGAADVTQLEEIATSPQHVFYVDLFNQLPQIVSQIDSLTCGACVSAEWDQTVSIDLANEDFRCVSVSCLSIPPNSYANVYTESGQVAAYTSTSQFGGPLNFTSSDRTTATTKRMSISGPSPYLILEGLDSTSTVTVTFQQAPLSHSAFVINTAPMYTYVGRMNEIVPNVPNAQYSISGPQSNLFEVFENGGVKVMSSLVGIPSPARFSVTVSSTVACVSRTVAFEVTITTAEPTSSPTRRPTTSFPTVAPTTREPTRFDETFSPSKPPSSSTPTVNPSTSFPTMRPSAAPTASPLIGDDCNNLPDMFIGDECGGGNGMCAENQDGGLYCSCAEGLLHPGCLPPAPQVVQPVADPLNSDVANRTQVAVVEAQASIGNLSFGVDDTLTTIEEITSVAGRRRSLSILNPTPFYIDPVTGIVYSLSPLPVTGTVTIVIYVTAIVANGAASEPTVVSLPITLVPNPSALFIEQDNSGASVSGGIIALIIILLLLCILFAAFFVWRFQNNKDDQIRKDPGVENPMYSTADLGLKTTGASEPLYEESGPGTVGGHTNPTYGVADSRSHGTAVNNTLYAPVQTEDRPSISNSTYSAVNPASAAAAADTTYDVPNMVNADPASTAVGGNYLDTAPSAVYDVGDDVDNIYSEAISHGSNRSPTKFNESSQYLDVTADDAEDDGAAYGTALAVGNDASPEAVAAPRRARAPTLSLDTKKPLPPNWHQAKDPQGNTYFYNSVTQESSWERPVAKVQVETNL